MVDLVEDDKGSLRLGARAVKHRVGRDLRVGGDVAVGAGTDGADAVLQGGVEEQAGA